MMKVVDCTFFQTLVICIVRWLLKCNNYKNLFVWQNQEQFISICVEYRITMHVGFAIPNLSSIYNRVVVFSLS